VQKHGNLWKGQTPFVHWQVVFRFMFFLEFAQSPDYDFFNIFYDLFLRYTTADVSNKQTKLKKKKKNNLPVDKWRLTFP
jgi:hypothetical protein